jgi:hypothetical protein
MDWVTADCKIEVKRLSTGKFGNPWDKLMALCVSANPDITLKMVVPMCGNFDILL